MKEIYTTKVMPFGYSGYYSYKVEIDRTDKHRQIQRHIFIDSNGNHKTEDWINSFGLTDEEILKGDFVKI